MTTPTPPPAPTRWLTRRRLLVVALVLVVALGVATRGTWWPTIELPTVDLGAVDPAMRRSIEERLDAVRKAPRSAEAWGTLGIVLDNNDFDEALKCFAQAERLEPTNPRWPHYQGIAYLKRDPNAALPKFQRATELSDDASPASRLRLADLYLQLGRFDEARAEYETLLRPGTNHPRAHLGLARLDFHAGKLALSRRRLRAPLAHPLTAKAALMLSAEINEREGKSAAARQDLAKAMESPRVPDWPDPFVNEAMQYNVGQAASVQKAEMLFDKRRPAEALKLLKDVVHEYPDAKAAWTLMGWAQIQMGRLDDAEKSLQTTIKLDPNAALPLMYMGMLRVTQKDRAGAKDYFRRAIDKKPDLFAAHFNLSQCLKEDGDRTGAIAQLRIAVQCQPFNARVHALLGELLLDDKQLEDAAFHLQEALVLNPHLQDAKKRLEDLKQKQTPSKKTL